MKLKQMRKESGLKTCKIAEILGISRIQLYNLENGKYKINIEKIEKFSEVYRKPKEEIIKAIKEGIDNE
ncbi:helix-turn-helix transcriptional regulator [uncultured Clostridium sp.]|uniref:helix-turn-helix domain-containing protein n=1 Tax=uncultured Clostridium sp. TaxID=59620 RepID=UPI0028EC5CBD|nr:helix-turn-helix transcriptional regulator [uncultured Clostridium sp.]